MTQRIDNQFLYNYIFRHQYAVLATVSPDNIPEAAVVGIAVTPDLNIIFDTLTTSRKYKNLRQNPHIAFVIGSENEETLQYEGKALFPDGEELDIIIEEYLETFPDGAERLSWPNICHICVEPIWVRYSNFNPNLQQFKEISF